MSASNRLAILLWLSLTCLSGCKPATLSKLEGQAMGTTWSLVLAKTVSIQEAESLQSLVKKELQIQESHFSNWDRNSVISRFNEHRSTDWFPVPPAVVEVALASRHLSQITDGAFDVTIHPKLQELGIQPGKAAPDAPVNYRALEIRSSPPALRKLTPYLTTNFTALVEGYAIDQTVQSLRNHGQEHFLFELGGEIFASGLHAHSKPWRVGVQHPKPEIKAPYAEIELFNEAISTSGTYRQKFETPIGRISHILDARTGQPVNYGVVSISVKHTKSLWADGLATALMTLSEKEAKKLAKKEGISALFILKQDINVDRKNP